MAEIITVDFRQKRVIGRTEAPVERWRAGRDGERNDLTAALRALRAAQGAMKG
jgi:hypothetical protein